MVTTVSQSLKDDTYTHFNTTREIQVVPNFIDTKDSLVEIDLEKRRRYAKDDERI